MPCKNAILCDLCCHVVKIPVDQELLVRHSEDLQPEWHWQPHGPRAKSLQPLFLLYSDAPVQIQ